MPNFCQLCHKLSYKIQTNPFRIFIRVQKCIEVYPPLYEILQPWSHQWAYTYIRNKHQILRHNSVFLPRFSTCTPSARSRYPPKKRKKYTQGYVKINLFLNRSEIVLQAEYTTTNFNINGILLINNEFQSCYLLDSNQN